MNLGELLNKKKLAPRGTKLEATQTAGSGYTLRMDYFTCNYRGCWNPAVEHLATGYYCEKHLRKEHI